MHFSLQSSRVHVHTYIVQQYTLFYDLKLERSLRREEKNTGSDRRRFGFLVLVFLDGHVLVLVFVLIMIRYDGKRG